VKRPQLSPKQEAFAQAVASGKGISEAYREVYNVRPGTKYETVNRSAKTLIDDPNVSARVDSLRQPIIKKAQYTLERHLQDLAELAELGKQAGQLAPAVSAVVAMGRATGLHVSRTELSGPGGAPIGVDLTWTVKIVEVKRADD